MSEQSEKAQARAHPGGLTVREYARMERVSEITVRRWIVKGAVPVRRTPGGGVRVIISTHK